MSLTEKRIAVFPGSFDPFTIGHESLVRRSIGLFDELIIAVGINATKTNMFTVEQRMKWIKDVFKDEKKVSVDSFTGLTIDYCRKKGAKLILRGLRTSADFEFEKAIAQMNHSLAEEIETIFILPLPEHGAINSTIIRDIVRNKGNASPFVPKGVDLT